MTPFDADVWLFAPVAVAGFSRGVECCCKVCSSDASWSFWVVIVEGSLDTVTIFVPGDLFK